MSVCRLFTAILLFCVLETSSQVLPQLSMYAFNKYYENAAYAGMERSLHVVATYRDQYSTFTKSPQTFYIGGDLPFYIWKGGIGASFQHSSAGLISQSHLRLSYNRVFSTQFGFISGGVRLGAQILSLAGNQIITPMGDYESSIVHNDPYLDALPVSGIMPSWEVSGYFYGKTVEVGMNVSHLPSHSSALGLGTFRFTPSFSFIGQYKWQLTEDIKFRPTILIKNHQSVWQSDVSLIGEWRDQTFGGLSLRGHNSNSFESIAVIFGSNINKKTRLAYSYDFGISALKSVHQGSHEFTVFYNLQQLIGIGLPPKIIYNPRHL